MARKARKAGAKERRDRTLPELTAALTEFAKERGWERFHSPKNLAMALSVEVGELLEHFQWLTEGESLRLSRSKISEIAEEAADVQIYLLMLAEKLRVNLARAVRAKIERNRVRYPADEVRRAAARARSPGAR